MHDARHAALANSITIPPQGDDFDPIRVEYTQMLQNQLARGNNGLIKTKYLTFSIEADSIRTAKPRLERIETDVLNNFKRLGVAAEVLDGKARLAQLHVMRKVMSILAALLSLPTALGAADSLEVRCPQIPILLDLSLIHIYGSARQVPVEESAHRAGGH